MYVTKEIETDLDRIQAQNIPTKTKHACINPIQVPGAYVKELLPSKRSISTPRTLGLGSKTMEQFKERIIKMYLWFLFFLSLVEEGGRTI